MELRKENLQLRLQLLYCQQEDWLPLDLDTDKRNADIEAVLRITGDAPRWNFELSFRARQPTRVRLVAALPGQTDYFHLIPGSLFGDNNLDLARPNEYPTLGERVEGDQARAPLWEFRADRAAMPVSMLCCRAGLAAVGVQPYVQTSSGEPIRSGLFAALPDRFGVSVGHTNDPLTFINKAQFGPSTCHATREATLTGSIFLLPGVGRLGAHQVIRALYGELRELPRHSKGPEEAIEGLLRSFAEINYSPEFRNYSNMACKVPDQPELQAWRSITEIGWTGGGVLAYPFLLAEQMRIGVELPRSGAEILDRISRNANPATGFLNETTDRTFRGELPPNWTDWPRNGWWSAYLPWTENRHCAYTNASAAYYLLKSVLLLQKQGASPNTDWSAAALGVLETAMQLQREDGNFGYVYEPDRPAVHDWQGFGGVWFAAALPLAWKLTGERRYLDAADRALQYYARFVQDLCCWGTPMDTWKSVDEEGNLAFIIACRFMHEATGDAQWLEKLQWGAEYEYLWRYGYKAQPEFEPLKSARWNSCGSSLTSVSNPHVHPMGLLVSSDLKYLAQKADDPYHLDRARDGIAWALQTLELYPERTGYGAYGVVSERFCPSDGLTIETYGDTGAPASTWWSYNAWAAANMLEALLEWQQQPFSIG